MSPFKIALIVTALVVLATAGAIWSASINASAGRLGAGYDSVGRCKVLEYAVNTSGSISTIAARMTCTVADTYNVTAVVSSGPESRTGIKFNQALSSTATTFSIPLSVSVPITGDAYTVVFSIEKA